MPPYTWRGHDAQNIGKQLTDIYLRSSILYLLAMAAAWEVGFEGIYHHPTPFYALISPAFTSPGAAAAVIALLVLAALIALRPHYSRAKWLIAVMVATGAALPANVLYRFAVGPYGTALSGSSHWAENILRHAVAIGTGLGGIFCLGSVLHRMAWHDRPITDREARRFVMACVVFAFSFAGATAMIRGGLDGISQAFERQAYEYIGDIGLGGSIPGLFRDYAAMHPYLSMHAKVHPPGPIVILWILSIAAGRTPLGLSVAAMAMGSLAVAPLYAWVQDLAGRRTALTCCALYTVVPSLVLFTATSTDITFMPLTLLTLFLFWRAIHRPSIRYAFAAGLLYGALTLTSFSLVSIGAFFGLVGLWRMAVPGRRLAVLRTALVMAAGLVAIHGVVRAGTGFDIVSCFEISKDQFDTDQAHLDLLDPRLPSWIWKFLNPACLFFFAGVPVSMLFLWRIARPRADTKSLFLIFAITLLAMNFLYLARGESERSAMYILPFVIVPAGHLLDEMSGALHSHTPLIATSAFLVLQTWFIEAHFYTYW